MKPRTARGFALYVCLLCLILGGAAQARAQGCTQCLDSTRATPPGVQAAYRHGILLLGGAATTFFLVGIAILRRAR